MSEMHVIGTRVRLVGWDVTGVVVGHGTMALSTRAVHECYIVELDEEHAAWHDEKHGRKPGFWVRNTVIHPENLVPLKVANA